MPIRIMAGLPLNLRFRYESQIQMSSKHSEYNLYLLNKLPSDFRSLSYMLVEAPGIRCLRRL